MNEKFGIPTSEIYTLSRGEPISEGQLLLKVWNQIHSGKTKECDLPGIFKKIKESKWNYGGAFYSVMFRVDRPINLIEIGFFGPFKDVKTPYFVHIELIEPLRKEVMPLCTSRRIAKNKIDLIAEPNETFFVDFGNPIPLRSKKWYLIQFKIEGPDMMRCEKTSTPITVNVNTGKSENDKVTFEFTRGSLQMPIIRFSMPGYEIPGPFAEKRRRNCRIC